MPEFKVLRYEGTRATVTWDAKRCIHAQECVHGLPAVFDAHAKPWVKPEAADVDALAATIAKCPTGALHIVRNDGRDAEPAPAGNTATVTENGPTYFRGTLELRDRDGSVVLDDTRMAICRCGQSQNKPLCDGSHRKADFRDAGTVPRATAKPASASAEMRLVMRPQANGPMLVTGPLTLTGSDGNGAFVESAYLCRCGHSQRKPYCDGTHRKIGFID
jgi:CDGSH-type Zn-finger protein/uncharacterized Fe-S cluster protein YjdI